MVASKGLLIYGGLLKVFCNSTLLRGLLYRRLVAVVFVALVLADIVATGAVANLLTTLAVGVPIIILHTSFRVRDDLEGPSADVAAENGQEDETAVVELVDEITWYFKRSRRVRKWALRTGKVA
ncbi:hypothetical protein BAE44_0014642 [Dichanthelium oligosanthes]|uniref:PRA1 family protein n=1 Tax=Dichanthelium oligosanthes TaxID=888268 RepID=A0A1E5VGR7_9POAL|nr:hypothetical protein BAE44_0014642 [Dichanthelium oligosanthes]